MRVVDYVHTSYSIHMTTKAAPEPAGRRCAWCRHCGEMIIREAGKNMPWYHVDDEQVTCS